MTSWPRRAHCLSVTVIGLVALVASACGSRHQYQGLIFEDPRPAVAIEGTAHTGAPYQLQDNAGELVLAFFGYTYCPDICPMTLANMAAAYRELETEAAGLVDDLNVLFVTVDPQRDTVERLAEYVPAFHPDFVGVYVPEAEQERIKAGYGVYGALREPEDEDEPYQVDHTAGIYLIDRQGNLQALFKSDMEPAALAADLQALLRDQR